MSVLQRAQAALAQGDFDTAYSLAEPLSRGNSDNSTSAHVLCANAAMQLAHWSAAIAHLQALRATGANVARPLAQCWLKQGNALKRAARLPEAEAAYREALATDAANSDAGFNLATLLIDSSRAAEALALLRGLDRASDVDAATLRALVALGRWQEALPLQRHLASTARTADEDREGVAAAASLALPAIFTPRLKAQFADPAQWRGALQFAACLRHDGDVDAAREVLDIALMSQHDPTARLRLHLARALGLPAVVDSTDALAAARADYADGLARLVVEYPPSRIASEQPDLAAFVWDNFYLAYHGENDRVLQQRYGEWLSAALQARLPKIATNATARSRPRIAIVSSFLRRCTVGSYFLSWAEHLGRSGFDVISVLLQAPADEVSRRYAQAGQLMRLQGPIEAMAGEIAALQADLILYPELGMDGVAFALAGLRLAPRQACAWGHPMTSGLPTIDTYFSCAEMEPNGASAHYSESLRLLPGLGTAYPAPTLPPRRSRESLGLPSDRVLYLLPQSPFKLHPDMDAPIAELLRRDARATIVGFLGPAGGASVRLARRFERAADAAGVDPRGCFHWLPACSREDYLGVNQACDVMLDSLRWSGGNASIDALCAGLPLITCPGDLMRGRQSQAMLRRLGREEWIASSPSELIERAIDVAHARRAGDGPTVPPDALAALLGDTAPLDALAEHLRERLAMPGSD